jgi:hypothetical protein
VSRVAAVAAGLAGVACGTVDFPATPAAPRPSDVEAVVYLIGDAGAATRDLPVIRQLKREVAERAGAAEVVVAFLGDNVYEDGLHEPTHPLYAQDTTYLEAQIDVVRGTNARAVFVPGNHDWGHDGERGLAQLRRQQAYLRAAAAPGLGVTFAPPAGCPGPASLPVGRSVLLVAIDTDVWLRDDTPAADCRSPSREAAVDALRAALAENRSGDRRHVVVLAHHPMKTYGPHGGYFSLKDQFFPATSLWAPLYIPIPFVYPILRNSGVSAQDLSHPRNQRMREALAAVFREFPEQPLAFAAGHEHALQVFRGEDVGVPYVLVSGAGSRLTPVGRDDALFAAGKQQGELGYMRIEFLPDGRVLLSVLTDGTRSCPGPDGCPSRPVVRYWRWLGGGAPER